MVYLTVDKMDNEIIIEFETKFSLLKKEIGFKTNLEDLDEIFLLKDSIMDEGYIPNDLFSLLSRRVVDFYSNLVNQLHSIILPNPNSMISITQNSMFTEDEREEMIQLMNKILALTSQSPVITITQNKKDKAKFVDGSFKLWDKNLKEKMKNISVKINKEWTKKSS